MVHCLISDTAFTKVSGACGAIDAPGQNPVAKTLSLPFALELGGPSFNMVNVLDALDEIL